MLNDPDPHATYEGRIVHFDKKGSCVQIGGAVKGTLKDATLLQGANVQVQFKEFDAKGNIVFKKAVVVAVAVVAATAEETA